MVDLQSLLRSKGEGHFSQAKVPLLMLSLVATVVP